MRFCLKKHFFCNVGNDAERIVKGFIGSRQKSRESGAYGRGAGDGGFRIDRREILFVMSCVKPGQGKGNDRAVDMGKGAQIFKSENDVRLPNEVVGRGSFR